MLFFIRNNNNIYTMVENNSGDGSCNFIPYDGRWCDNVVP